MTWQLIRFGDVPLPLYQLKRDDAGRPDTAAHREFRIETINGPFDRLGTQRGRGEARQLNHMGFYVGDNAAEVQRQVEAILRLMWTRQQLWRRNRDGSEHWVYARLVQATPVEIGFKTYQKVALVFETMEDSWRGTKRTASASGTTASVPLPNAGNAAVRDVIITVTGNQIQSFSVSISGDTMSTKFEFSNSPTTYSTVVVDAGTNSVNNGAGTSLYGGFELLAAHNHEGWFYLPPGGARVLLGGSAVVGVPSYRFEYWERWQ